MELNYHIVRILNEEKDNLERMLSEAKASIRDAPEGRVRLKMNLCGRQESFTVSSDRWDYRHYMMNTPKKQFLSHISKAVSKRS